MATTVYLSNDPSGISGYLLAYIGERSPNASSTASTAVTNTVAGVTTTTVTMTLTAGGSTAKWITVPLKAAVTIATKPFFNLWALESNAAANCDVAWALQQYTTSAQTAFMTSSTGVELTTSIARQFWVGAAGESITSTAFAVADRLIIAPALGAVGTMATGYTVTMDYNQSTSGSDGDVFMLFNEDFEPGTAQVGTGTAPGIKAVGVSYFYNIAQVCQEAIDAGLIGSNASVTALIDEATNQQALV